MTFTEAAAQVLRLVGKPLHYKEITDVAIEKNLLSHVGKSPEVTMGARLAALVKKGDKETPLVRVKPGVFALRDWDPATIEKGLEDRTPALERLAAQLPGEPDEADDATEAAEPGAGEEVDEDDLPILDPAERARAELAAHANEFFESEEDDDEPIFSSAGDAPADAGERALDGGARRRRRRRRGRGRSGEARTSDGLPSYTVSDAPAELAEPASEAERVAPAAEASFREPPVHEPRRAPERAQPERAQPERAQIDAGSDDYAGRGIADGLAQLLATFDRNRGPVALQTLVDGAQRRGRFFGEQAVGQGLLAVAARADNARALSRGERPRFRFQNGRIGLSEWALDPEAVRLEREIRELTERHREATRRTTLRLLQDLPQRALGDLVALLLEHVGFVELVPVRRQGSHGAELHLAGKLRTAAGELRTAVVIRRDGREIGRERVTDLRGALHHYGPAHAGWLLTTGQVLSGAREEAAAPGAAPVTVVDGLGLVRLCEENAVGVVRTHSTLVSPDLDLLDGLRSG